MYCEQGGIAAEGRVEVELSSVAAANTFQSKENLHPPLLQKISTKKKWKKIWIHLRQKKPVLTNYTRIMCCFIGTIKVLQLKKPKLEVEMVSNAIVIDANEWFPVGHELQLIIIRIGRTEKESAVTYCKVWSPVVQCTYVIIMS